MPTPAMVARLEQAMALLRGGQLDDAGHLLDGVLKSVPGDPDALQLSAILARRRGDQETAVALFRRSLTVRPDQPHVCNNLGNALAALGKPQEAIDAYRDALALDPGYSDATVNLGLAQLTAGNAAEAIAILSAQVAREPDRATAWTALGSALRAAERLNDAIVALQKAAALRPDHLPTLHNLAVALRLSGAAEEARVILERCTAAPVASGVAHYNLGHCYHDLGRMREALEQYERAVALAPLDRDMQDTLSRVRWQSGHADSWLAGYGEALQRYPNDAGLLADLAAKLNLAGRARDSVTILTDAVSRGVTTAAMQHQLGQALFACDRIAEGIAALRASVKQDPAYDAARLDLVRALIAAGETAEIEPLLAPLQARNADDQQAIAYRALAWRITGDPRAEWLNDTDRFLSTRVLLPPPGEGDVTAFNARLEARLAALHEGSALHPIEQTLRGGTQTMGNLFDRAEPEIATVKAMIRDAVAEYITALPDDPNHPFLSRKTKQFRFSGSWSVRLSRQGFHVNHVHSEGWISSCYYAGLPPAIDAGGNEGWITFGQSSLGLPQGDGITAMVRPEVGMLILFPSFLYHGTLPFDDTVARTTLAFDVVPG